MSPTPGDDPFGTAAIRAASLTAWLSSPTRLREDANSEEDHARGYYRDRALVELAQNAADAAVVAAGATPAARPAGAGRLLLRLRAHAGGALLTAANTGTSLTSEGVLALASMRASAKRAPFEARSGERDVAPTGIASIDRGATDPASPHLQSTGAVRTDSAPTDSAPTHSIRVDFTPTQAATAAATSPATPVPATVGRFGVGFSAVRALSDEIAIASSAGTVLFSAAAARAVLSDALAEHSAAETSRAIAGSSAPTAETSEHSILTTLRQVLDRPTADLPILRLPFAIPDGPHAARSPLSSADLTVPPGYDTVVVARLRDSHERDVVRRLLDAVDDALLLALPALAEIRIEIDGADHNGVELRILAGAAERWLTVHAEGHHRAVDLADRPNEERARTGWSLTWAFPRTDTPADLREHLHDPYVLHSPTPTEEPCTLPALLVATFPLDPSRRHVAPGAATDALAVEAGAAYAELAEQVARDGGDALALVPTGLAAGRLDGLLRAAALDALRSRPLLAPVAHDGGAQHAGGAQPSSAHQTSPRLLSPREAQAIAGAVGHDPQAVAALSRAAPGLVVVPRGLGAQARLRAVGVEIRDLGDVVDGLPTQQPPSRWRVIYDALAPHLAEPGLADALAGLPVPLADGRTVRGPRGLVAPSGALDGTEAAVEALAPWGLRVIDPAAVHPLLTRLGAVECDARGLLAQAAVRAAVAAAARGDLDPEQEDDVARAALALVAAAIGAGADPDDLAAAHPWLAALPLPDVDGEPAPARCLTVPGSWADLVLDALRPADPELVAEHGAAVLRAVGVRDGLKVVRIADVVAEERLGWDEDAPEDYLDGWSDYLAELAESLGPGAYVGEVAAVADLDAVAEGSWPKVLTDLAADPRARAALLMPVRSGAREAPSYTSWWLRDYFGAPFAAPGAQVPFLHPAPPGLAEVDDVAPRGTDAARAKALEPAVLVAIGAVGDLGTLDASGWERYLDGLPAEGTPVAVEAAAAIWRGLVTLVWRAGAARARLRAERLPVLRAASGDGPGPTAWIAAAADVVVAAEPMWAQVADVFPAPSAVADAVAEALDLDSTGERELLVKADNPEESVTPAGALVLVPGAPGAYVECDALSVDGVDVGWWVARGRVHAATTAGLARGLAQYSSRWEVRADLETVLTNPGQAEAVLAERAWDPP